MVPLGCFLSMYFFGILTVILFFPIDIILRPFTKNIESKKRESFSYIFTVCLAFVVMVFSFLPDLVSGLMKDIDLLAAFIAFFMITTFFAFLYIRKIVKENDELSSELNKYKNGK